MFGVVKVHLSGGYEVVGRYESHAEAVEVCERMQRALDRQFPAWHTRPLIEYQVWQMEDADEVAPSGDYHL